MGSHGLILKFCKDFKFGSFTTNTLVRIGSRCTSAAIQHLWRWFRRRFEKRLSLELDWQILIWILICVKMPSGLHSLWQSAANEYQKVLQLQFLRPTSCRSIAWKDKHIRLQACSQDCTRTVFKRLKPSYSIGRHQTDIHLRASENCTEGAAGREAVQHVEREGQNSVDSYEVTVLWCLRYLVCIDAPLCIWMGLYWLKKFVLLRYFDSCAPAQMRWSTLKSWYAILNFILNYVERSWQTYGVF